MNINWRTVLAIIILVLLLIVLFTTPVQLPEKVGVADFRPYWSSSYLLAHGRDFGDSEQLDHVERTLTGWEDPFTMYAWFAPLGNLILIPYTYLPFSKAVFYWLITSVIAVTAGSILIWPYKKTMLWVPIVVTFSYSMTLVSFADGQINTLEILGLALFLVFSEAKQDIKAGISLTLTTIKPHLVILTLPLLALDMVRKKNWRALVGFTVTMLVYAVVLTAFYPNWLNSFLQLVRFGMILTRETPTINGLFVLLGKPLWGKWLWMFALGIAILLWAKFGKDWNKRTLIDVTILAGLTISPAGWSYDQIMLLFPLLRIFEWITASNTTITKTEAWSISAILFIANGYSYYQRNLGISDVWFFWVPLFVACVYFYVYLRMKNSRRYNVRLSPAQQI